MWSLALGRPIRTGNGWSLRPQEGSGLQSVVLEAWMLPELAEVVVALDASAAPGTVESAAGGANGGGTPIPVVPEMC